VLGDVTSLSLHVHALSLSAVVMPFFRAHYRPKNMTLSLFNRLFISLTTCTASSFRVLSMLLHYSKACFTLFKFFPLTEGGGLHEAQVDVPPSGSHCCV